MFVPDYFLNASLFSDLVQSFQPEDLQDHSLIQEAASSIVGTLSKRQNSTVMLAVIEVKVETQVTPPSVGKLI